MTDDASTKTCPFCAEEIKSAARKCKHCGERLDKERVPSGGRPSGAALPPRPVAAGLTTLLLGVTAIVGGTGIPLVKTDAPPSSSAVGNGELAIMLALLSVVGGIFVLLRRNWAVNLSGLLGFVALLMCANSVSGVIGAVVFVLCLVASRRMNKLKRVAAAGGAVLLIAWCSSALAEPATKENCDPHPDRFWHMSPDGAAAMLLYIHKQANCMERNEIRWALRDDPKMLKKLERIWATITRFDNDEDHAVDSADYRNQELRKQSDEKLRATMEDAVRSAIATDRQARGSKPSPPQR